MLAIRVDLYLMGLTGRPGCLQPADDRSTFAEILIVFHQQRSGCMLIQQSLETANARWRARVIHDDQWKTFPDQ